nr:GNAT family N-acetyltransferase [Acuticoccus mangrovi]
MTYDVDMVRPLTAGDLDGALALSMEAGWNQTREDWRLIMWAGRAYGIGAEGRLVATAAIIPYPPFAWIAMVLVSGKARGRGLARRLMGQVMSEARMTGLVAALDATPAGRNVYTKLGFRDAGSLVRLSCNGPARLPAGETRADIEIAPLDGTAISQVAHYDRPVFGADRGPVIASLARRTPNLALVARRASRIVGFAVGRNGSQATGIGPVVADDAEVATALLARLLPRVAGRLVIDVHANHPLRARLEAAGMAVERGFTRMLFGEGGPVGDLSRVVAIAGPELG